MSQAIFDAQDVFEIHGRGVVVAGKLESGILSQGMKANINGVTISVEGIETTGRKLETADATTQPIELGILLKNATQELIDNVIIGGQKLAFEVQNDTQSILNTNNIDNRINTSPANIQRTENNLKIILILLAMFIFIGAVILLLI